MPKEAVAYFAFMVTADVWRGAYDKTFRVCLLLTALNNRARAGMNVSINQDTTAVRSWYPYQFSCGSIFLLNP